MYQIPSTVWPGSPYPLGATWDGKGVNFAVFSENATMMSLCLFDANDKEVNRINLRWNSEGVWHCYLPQARPGQRYGFRAHGTYDPERGQFFNPYKLLMDPYAKQIAGCTRWCDEIYHYRRQQGQAQAGKMTQDTRDSAPFVPKSVVIDGGFDWQGDTAPDTPRHRTVIYEMHVKGFSRLNEAVPAELRGTYAGLGHQASLDYLKQLGVTAVELLPVHCAVNEGRLQALGLTNYWGYNTLGFFAPDARWAASDDPVKEFKEMVRSLHLAGLEIILDVVYNHTAEQGADGPSLCWRGLDNATYYRLVPNDPSHCLNFTGCGNSIDTRHPRTLQMIMDSLRYWVQEMHVDGFRFDLATTLARTGQSNNYQRFANFLASCAQDPVLNRIKLIAEPWDCGPGGYQVGAFPKGWSEWNGDWRDSVRRFWKGDGGLLGKIASKLSGSSDLYWDRSPLSSLNFVTAHDGFTLADLVTYQQKHNEANLESNRDGANDNCNWNCGVEGPSSDPEIKTLRLRQQRNMLFTLMLSLGIPMLTAGDEICRTQKGNNNAYCQDNPLSYLNWNLNADAQSMLAFTTTLIHLRLRHPVFLRNSFFRGEMEPGGLKDVIWLNPEGQEMKNDDWNSPFYQCLGMFIYGKGVSHTDRKGFRLRDDSFLLILNADSQSLPFTLPQFDTWSQWEVVLDTAHFPAKAPIVRQGHDSPYVIGSLNASVSRYQVELTPRSCLLLREIPRQA